MRIPWEFFAPCLPNATELWSETAIHHRYDNLRISAWALLRMPPVHWMQGARKVPVKPWPNTTELSKYLLGQRLVEGSFDHVRRVTGDDSTWSTGCDILVMTFRAIFFETSMQLVSNSQQAPEFATMMSRLAFSMLSISHKWDEWDVMSGAWPVVPWFRRVADRWEGEGCNVVTL